MGGEGCDRAGGSLDCQQRQQQAAVADLQEAFDESDLPFRVDLLVWHELPERFHQTIAADYAVVQQATRDASQTMLNRLP
jgi:uncharacterized protein